MENLMTSLMAVRQSVLQRAEALEWPVCVSSGVAVSGAPLWQRTVAGALRVELEQIARQLDDLEAQASRARLPEPRSAQDPVPMMDDEELAAQRVQEIEDAVWLEKERARQDEELRQAILREHGIV